MTLRLKIVALVVGLTALVLLGLGSYLTGAFGGWSQEAADHELLERAARLARLVDVEEEGELKVEDEGGEALRDPAHPYRLTGPGGEAWGTSTTIPWPEAGGEPLRTVSDAGGRAWRVASGAFEVGGRHGRATVAVQVAGAVAPFAALVGPFRRGLLVALAVALLLGGLGAALLAHASLRPLGRLAAQVDGIGAASLDRRVALDGLDPELGRVAGAFNALLGRLEAARLQERQLVARASHALRTPVATIRTRAEVALRRERDPAAYREALAEVGAAAAEATTLIANLLVLSRLDEHGAATARQPVALAPVAEEVLRLLGPRAEEGGVALALGVAPDLAVPGDRAALRELLEALLDNAVQHAPRGGRAGIEAAPAGAGLTLTVWDTGPGIPEGERARVLERFYRGEGAQASGRPGSGLGLAIVKAVVDRHEGQVWAERTEQGARFTIRIPSI